MLPEDVADDAAEVKADGFMKVVALSCVGVSFTPRDGNAGGYPVVAYVNDDLTTRHVIRGPGFLRDIGLITSVKVDARPGGGLEGDVWDVTLLPTPTAGLDERFRRDSDGFLATRPAGHRVLFDIQSQESPTPFLAAFAGGQTGNYGVLPTNPRAFDKTTAGLWDVSRFNNLQLVIDQLGAGLAWSCQAFINGHYADSGNWVDSIGAGAVNEFGLNSATPWVPVSIGSIQLGAGENAATDFTQRSTDRFSHVSFRLVVSNNTQVWETIDWNLVSLRIRAHAW